MTLSRLPEADPAGTDAAALLRMAAKTMVALATDFDRLDSELSRWLRARATGRAAADRDESALDGLALGLRKLRATMAFTVVHASFDDPAVVALVSRTYRWTIRVARELVAIEAEALDPIVEWARLEAFAPFALAFFESVLAAPLQAASRTPEMARLRREIDAVRAPLVTAMTSSSLAA